MPNIRKKFAGFIRQLSNQPDNTRFDISQPTSENCAFQKYIGGKGNEREEPEIIYERNPENLPPKKIGKIYGQVIAAMTGPNGGLTTINKKKRHLSISDPDVHFIDVGEEDVSPAGKDANSNTSMVNCNLIQQSPSPVHNGFLASSCSLSSSLGFPLQKSESAPEATASGLEEIAGVLDWETGNESAYGISTSLYERNPITGVPAGEPIADCFGVVARTNSGLLVLADGVNWGPRSSLAARAAVHASIDHINSTLFLKGIYVTNNPETNIPPLTTNDAFGSLIGSFESAQDLILECGGALTTLTSAVVLPLASSSKDSELSQDRYIVCVCNVGDSLAYVYSPKYGVREITQGSHDVDRMRDMRDALGALGPADGVNPELGNLTFSMTEVESGDIVFITSDGVSDNLDPVVGKFAGVDGVEARERHRLGLLRAEDLLRNGIGGGGGGGVSTAKEASNLLVEFVTRLTSAKRHLLEGASSSTNGPGSEGGSSNWKRRKRLLRSPAVSTSLSSVPGKLDHATVVAYKVGNRIGKELDNASHQLSPLKMSNGGTRSVLNPENIN